MFPVVGLWWPVMRSRAVFPGVQDEHQQYYDFQCFPIDSMMVPKVGRWWPLMCSLDSTCGPSPSVHTEIQGFFTMGDMSIFTELE